MIRRTTAALFAVCLAGAAMADAVRGPDFQPLEKAKAISRETFKGIAVYSVVNQNGHTPQEGTVGADWAVNDSVRLEGARDWVWVHCGDVKTAIQCGVGEAPELHFFDCDFQKVHSTSVSDLKSVEAALQSAGDKYSSREISWQDYDEDSLKSARETGRKLVLLAFTSDRPDSKETLDNLTHKAIAKYHGKLL